MFMRVASRSNGMRPLLACLFFGLAPSCTFAQSVAIQGINIVNLGIYDLETRKGSIGDNVQGRAWDVVRKIRQVQATTVIPARPCLSFGFEYLIVGAPAGAIIPIKMVTNFPGKGLYDPITRTTTFRSETLVSRMIGRTLACPAKRCQTSS